MKLNVSTDSYIPFGGKVVVLGGDFRQNIPVIQKGSRSDILGFAINSPYLWKYCKVLRLTKITRLMNSTSNGDAEETIKFAGWILNAGDGKINFSGDALSDIDIP